jgi:hypothetical protein
MDAGWKHFFVAAAGAAAALAGLIFVALSVNIARILEYAHLPSRAGAAIGSLMLILTASLAALIPQPLPALGGETLGLTALAWWLQVDSMRRSRTASRDYGRPRHEFWIEVVMSQSQMAPNLAAGVMLMLGSAAGLYWLAGGTVLIFTFAVVNAWVLLVEILR